jgi:hypothetical protein
VNAHQPLATFDLDEGGTPDAAVTRRAVSLELLVRSASIPLRSAMR